MNNQPRIRAFRTTLTTIAILTVLVFGISSFAGTFFHSKNINLATYNLVGISRMIPAIAPSVLIGILTMIASMYAIGSLLGQSWRDNIRAMLDRSNNDSTFVLSERIAIATTFTTLSVPMMDKIFLWSLILVAKLVVLLSASIVITAILSAFIIWAAQDTGFHWYQIDRWWVHMMIEPNNDMVARMTGMVFQIVGVAMLGALLIAQL